MIGNVKHGNFDRMLGFLYIAAQFAGAMVGGILSGTFATGKVGNQIQLNVPPEAMFQQFVVEMMASFFLVFMYLCSTEKKTKFTDDHAIQTIILAGAYLGAMLLSGTKIK